MYFKTNYDGEFDDLYMYLKAKYPDKLFDLEGIGKQTDMSAFSKTFFASSTTADASVDANSNVDDMTVVAYENELPKPFTRLNSLYLFWKYGKQLFGLDFANNIIERELVGDFYINDLSNIQKPYCYNFSTYDVMTKGLPFVKKIDSKPAKHLSSFCGQMIHFTSYASNQVMGAVGLADLLIVMSYYVKKEFKDNPDIPKEYIWKQVKQEIQSLIYSMNQPFRGGLQSGFYNVSIYDDYFLDSMIGNYLFPDGSTPDKEYIYKLQDIYLDLMNETMEISPITFPVTTACFCVDEDRNILDKDFLDYIAKKNLKWAFINIYAGESSTLSSCCRLRSKQDNEYLGYTNSFGGGGTQIGSYGVVTLNLPKIALKSNGDKEIFFKNLKELAISAIKVNHVKKFVLQKRINSNALPLYTHGFMDMQKQYSTIGLNGVYECIEIMGMDILNKDGQDFCGEILNFLNNINDEADKKYKYAHNMEMTPSENSAIKLAQKDKILKLQDTYELYSNQFIPLIKTADMLDRITLQGKFDSEFSGGSIMHVNCDSEVKKYEDLVDMIEVTVKTGCIYHAINYNLQKCANKHMTVGKSDICSVCGEKITDNYIRAVGFIVNVKNFHHTRRDEDYAHRQFYTAKDIGVLNVYKS